MSSLLQRKDYLCDILTYALHHEGKREDKRQIASQM